MLRLAAARSRSRASLLAPATAAADGVFSDPGLDDRLHRRRRTSIRSRASTPARSIRFTRFGGAGLGGGDPCIVSPTTRASTARRPASTSVLLNLGDGDDVAAVSPHVTLPVIFNGGAGNDGLFGGGGTTSSTAARATTTSSPATGAASRSTAAPATTPRSATTPTRAAPARRSRATPTATASAAPPTATTPTPGSARAPPTRPTTASTRTAPAPTRPTSTVDGDGSPRPQDCDDSDPRDPPGRARDRRQRVDENCDTRARRSRRSAASCATSGRRPAAHGQPHADGQGLPERHADRAALLGPRLPVRGGSSGASAAGRAVNLHCSFGDRALARGARVELRLTRAGGSAASCASGSARPARPASTSCACRPAGACGTAERYTRR